MRTYLDCIPCFYRQALVAARHAGATPEKQKEILDNLAKALPGFSLTLSPPEMAREVYAIVSKTLGSHSDLYKAIKEKSNRLALTIYADLKQRVKQAKDPLLLAVELAIAGNIIDYAAKASLNLEEEINKVLTQEEKTLHKDKSIFHYLEFKKILSTSKTILYLADNAGEVVFDKILIEEILKNHPDKNIIYVVKEKPIINDALMEDAIQCGIDQLVPVISSGSDASGTVLSLCSPKFLTLFQDADMVISKGQGNFEALSNEERPIFFLFKIKCPVVAESIQGEVGDTVLFYKACRKNKR